MKEKLTIEKTEEFAREKYASVESLEDREFHILHSKEVGNAASLIAEKTGVDKESLVISA